MSARVVKRETIQAMTRDTTPYVVYGRHMATRVDDPLFTIDQVAEYCNVSRRLVQNWIYAGDLNALKLGGRTIRVRQSALDEFLDRPYDPMATKTGRRANGGIQ